MRFCPIGAGYGMFVLILAELVDNQADKKRKIQFYQYLCQFQKVSPFGTSHTSFLKGIGSIPVLSIKPGKIQCFLLFPDSGRGGKTFRQVQLSRWRGKGNFNPEHLPGLICLPFRSIQLAIYD
jgi:hypothetical protein